MKGRKATLDNVVPMKTDCVVVAPDAPDYLCETGRAVWDGLAPWLMARRRLEPGFVYQFGAYCSQVAMMIAAANDIALHGSHYETKGRHGVQHKRRATVGLLSESIARMNQLSAQFGLSPIDDQRFGEGGQGDLFARMIAELKGEGPGA